MTRSVGSSGGGGGGHSGRSSKRKHDILQSEAEVKLLSPPPSDLNPPNRNTFYDSKMGSPFPDSGRLRKLYPPIPPLHPPGEIQMIEKSILKNQIKDLQDSSEKEKFDKVEIELDERCRTVVHWTKIIWALISFIISVADVLVIIYISYLHFSHSSDIVAWLMLLPILLNFIGIFTFLSDDEERHEMETLGCQNTVWKNLMFFPIIGPSVCCLKLFVLSMREHEADRFERLESLTLRMKQYESYFRAAPEAFVQITFRIITWSRAREFHSEDYWTNLCLILCMFALAESHMYATVVPYYRMFQRDQFAKSTWNVEHIRIRWRILLFFFNFLSIESRLYADAIFKATCCFYFRDQSFGEVLIIAFLVQFLVRAALYSSFVSFMGSKQQRHILKETGVYGAFTYSWRSLFMSFDYQSFHPSVFLSFYIENFTLIVCSYIVIFTLTDVDLRDKYVFNVYAVFTMICIFLAIGARFVLKKVLPMRIIHTAKVHAARQKF